MTRFTSGPPPRHLFVPDLRRDPQTCGVVDVVGGAPCGRSREDHWTAEEVEKHKAEGARLYEENLKSIAASKPHAEMRRGRGDTTIVAPPTFTPMLDVVINFRRIVMGDRDAYAEEAAKRDALALKLKAWLESEGIETNDITWPPGVKGL